ncbi:MAG: hypothetical protein HKN43_10215, partial [Rhodothermales bacterium]|nr:hypothetical protein [Rhodothermales bacterium]
MLVRHFSTNVPGNCYPGNNLALPLRSEINELVGQDTGIRPDSMSREDTLSDNGESLYLNVTQTDDALVIEAELSDFGPDDVDVS